VAQRHGRLDRLRSHRRGAGGVGHCLDPGTGGREPAPRRRIVPGVQGKQVGRGRAVVEDHAPGREQQRRVRVLGAVARSVAAALGLEFIAEVADPPAPEVEGEVLAPDDLDGAQAVVQPVQEGPDLAVAALSRPDGDRAGGDIGGDHLRERALGRPHHREAAQARIGPAAVQPERVGLVEEQRLVDLLRVAVGGELLHQQPVLHPPLGVRAAGAGRLRALRAGGPAVPQVPFTAQLREVGQQAVSVPGRDGLGVELHAPLGTVAVPQGHQYPVRRPGERLQIVREAVDRPRVVAHDLLR
jgi:hypothetical protein